MLKLKYIQEANRETQILLENVGLFVYLFLFCYCCLARVKICLNVGK